MIRSGSDRSELPTGHWSGNLAEGLLSECLSVRNATKACMGNTKQS